MSDTKPLSGSTPAGPGTQTAAPSGSPYRNWPNEIMLNTSVDRSDEKRLSHQTRQVLELFRAAFARKTTVTTAQLAEISLQYNGRLFELRRYLVPKGWCIDLIRRGENGLGHYAVVPLKDSVFFAKHKSELEAEALT